MDRASFTSPGTDGAVADVIGCRVAEIAQDRVFLHIQPFHDRSVRSTDDDGSRARLFGRSLRSCSARRIEARKSDRPRGSDPQRSIRPLPTLSRVLSHRRSR